MLLFTIKLAFGVAFNNVKVLCQIKADGVGFLMGMCGNEHRECSYSEKRLQICIKKLHRDQVEFAPSNVPLAQYGPYMNFILSNGFKEILPLHFYGLLYGYSA